MELLTPRGLGGVAVFSAQPEDRERVLSMLATRGGAAFVAPSDGRPARAVWTLPSGLVDDVLVVDRGPSGLEVHAHGGIAVLEAVASAFGPLVERRLRAADELLHRAVSREQVALALEQRQHDFDGWLRDVRALPRHEVVAELQRAMARAQRSMALARASRVVLAGEQNAGKSTLFNRIVFAERALAGPLAGLTRDPVAEVVALSGYPYEVVDTAGEAAELAGVDAVALARARAERADADLVLLVVAGNRTPTASDLRIAAAGAVVLATKADLPAAGWPTEFRAAARLHASDPGSAPSIRAQVGELLRAHRGLPPAGPVGGIAPVDAEQLRALSELASEFGVASA